MLSPLGAPELGRKLKVPPLFFTRLGQRKPLSAASVVSFFPCLGSPTSIMDPLDGGAQGDLLRLRESRRKSAAIKFMNPIKRFIKRS